MNNGESRVRRRWCFGGCLVAAVAVALLAAAIARLSHDYHIYVDGPANNTKYVPGYTDAKWLSVKEGMKRDDAIRILGQPFCSSARDGSLYYSLPRPGRTGVPWLSYVVKLNRRDRVTDVSVYGRKPHPTFWEWLLHREQYE